MVNYMQKTNAMRILEKMNIAFEILEYDVNDGKISGTDVAQKIGANYNEVFKTLVCTGKDKVYIFIVPVDKELDTKKAATLLKEKNIEMIPQKQLLPLTGYVHGGCSPIGMKKQFETIIDDSASERENIIVNAGKIGMQMKVSINGLIAITGAILAPITK